MPCSQMVESCLYYVVVISLQLPIRALKSALLLVDQYSYLRAPLRGHPGIRIELTLVQVSRTANPRYASTLKMSSVVFRKLAANDIEEMKCDFRLYGTGKGFVRPAHTQRMNLFLFAGRQGSTSVTHENLLQRPVRRLKKRD